MGFLRFVEDTFCMIFRPSVYEKRLVAELESVYMKGQKEYASRKLGKKIMTQDDAEMLCTKASKTLSDFCDDKSSFQLKNMPVVKQAVTVAHFLFDGEKYEQSYLADRLQRIGGSSAANAYLNKKRKESRQRD